MDRNRTDFQYHLFVSHAEDCKEWAETFIDNLKSLGLMVWHRGCVSYGEEADQAANMAITESVAFLAIISPGAICSQEMSKDLDRASSKHGCKKVVRVLVSDYECAKPSGREVRLVSYNTQEYVQTLVALASQVLGESVVAPKWEETPPPKTWPVEATVWCCALDIAEFIVSFTDLWRKYEPEHDRLRANGRHQRDYWDARREAYRYLYNQRCYASADILFKVLNEFRSDFSAAKRLVDFNRGRACDWWKEAYDRIAEAAEGARLAQEAARDDAIRRYEDDREAVERASAQRERAERVRAEQERERWAGHVDAERVADGQSLPTKDEQIERKGPSLTNKCGTLTDASPVHFLIITALEEERDAALSKLPGVRKLDRDGSGAHTYYEARVPTKREDGSEYRVILTSLSGMGPIKGAIKAGAIISRWKPEHVLLVGIAGGVEGEVALGDVIVASQVADYTAGKVHETGRREERWASYPADADLLDAATNFPVGWEELIVQPRCEPGTPQRLLGVVASGGDVIASKKQIATYRADWPKLIGVEMEGGGVAAGLHDDIERPRFLMIRGVSDLANRENNTETKRAWRAYACHVAAAYAIGLLRDGPVSASRAPVSAAPLRDVSSVAMSTTPQTWDELAATSPTYQVNSYDDVVICMHPDAERAWRDVVPNARNRDLTYVTIETPEGPWHRQTVDLAAWQSVYQQIECKVADIRAAKAKRIHLVVKAPFSLGALLGARLDPQNHELVVYQHDNKEGAKDTKVWRPWGPRWPTSPAVRSEPFFESLPELGHVRSEENGDIAVVVNITGQGDPKACKAVVQARNGQRPVRSLPIKARDAGQGAIRIPADADKASNESSTTRIAGGMKKGPIGALHSMRRELKLPTISAKGA